MRDGREYPMTGGRRVACHIAAAAFAIAVISPVAIMLLDRRTVLEITDAKIEPSPVEVGGTAVITWTAIEWRNCEGTFRRVIVDSENVEHQFGAEWTVYHDAMQVTPRQFRKTFTIPTAAHAGPATYFTYIVRWCNVIQKYVWPMRETSPRIAFEITKGR